MTHPFDEALQLQRLDEHTLQGQTLPVYDNMVGPFGGILAATMLHALQQETQSQGEPVSVNVNYAGPVAATPFEIRTQCLRSNRSTTHAQAQLIQDGKVAVYASAVFARRHETWTAQEQARPEVPAAAQCPRQRLDVGPRWLGAYDMRFIEGELKLDGQPREDTSSLLWVRDEPPRALDFAALLAMSDIFFPRSFIRQQQLGIAGTIALSTHFHATAETLARTGSQHLLARARGQGFRRGYFDQSAQLWNADGELLASSLQSVYYKG